MEDAQQKRRHLKNDGEVQRIPTKNSNVFVIGALGAERQMVKVRDGQILEERPYLEGFTLDGILLAPKVAAEQHSRSKSSWWMIARGSMPTSRWSPCRPVTYTCIQEVQLALGAIEAYHQQGILDAPSLQQRRW